jgi:hypothetical protein
MKMNEKSQIARRTFLKGLGTAMALPMLDAMLPVRALAGASPSAAAAAPVRMAFLFVPNGIHMPDFTPKALGANFDLPNILEPLAPVKNDLLVLSGLTHDKGRANGDGPGDHARSAAVYLTGVQPLKSEGSSIRAGVSVDQYAAEMIGQTTRFPSLEIGIEPGRQSGHCDSGYSCAYSNNISWKNEVTPMTKETNPRRVFERLFANELQKEVAENRARREHYKKSILDFVMDDARKLRTRVGGADRQKVDEYLTAVREIELRITRLEQQDRANGVRASVLSGFEDTKDIADSRGAEYSLEEHIRLMGDMMVLAFQTDVTRVLTYMFANEGSNRDYRFIGVNEGHHSLSHHQGNPVNHDKLRQINRFHVTQLAYILQRLKSIPEGEGTLLDNCMIVYGSAISDGNKHNNEDLPVLLAGGGGGTIRTGRHIKYRQETPMTNLYVSMLERMGVKGQGFGDSTGSLRWLDA